MSEATRSVTDIFTGKGGTVGNRRLTVQCNYF